MKFIIKGVNRSTGKDMSGTISADSEEDARAQAAKVGFVVTSVKVIEVATPSSSEQRENSSEQRETSSEQRKEYLLSEQLENYPFLGITRQLYVFVAVLNLTLCIISAAVVSIMYCFSEQDPAGRLVAAGGVVLIIFAYAMLSSLGLLTTGESIKLVMDIEKHLRAIRYKG